MEACAQGVRRALLAANVDSEVIVVDDGSRDGTADQANRYMASIANYRLSQIPHKGKGGALQAGVAASSGQFVFLADADWSMPPEQIVRFLPPRLSDFDLAIANRELSGSERHGEPQYRHLLGRVFNRWVQLAVLKGIQDSQCGFKCIRGELARRLFPQIQTQGWAFDVELLALAKRDGAKLVQQPIDWDFNADSRIRPWRHAPQMALDVLRIRKRLR
jgi:glycosyltransferase involved in cell wall biosynthesis